MTPQVYGCHVKIIQIARVHLIVYTKMHTRCPTAMRIPRKNAYEWHDSTWLCTSKCIQDVPQLCGHHVKMHTNGPTGMPYKWPHRYADTTQKWIQRARVYLTVHVEVHTGCPTAMRVPRKKKHKDSPTGMWIPRKNAYKWHESIWLCTWRCIQDVPQLCRYHVKIHTGYPGKHPGGKKAPAPKYPPPHAYSSDAISSIQKL